VSILLDVVCVNTGFGQPSISGKGSVAEAS